jgi:hypothetical protein
VVDILLPVGQHLNTTATTANKPRTRKLAVLIVFSQWTDPSGLVGSDTLFASGVCSRHWLACAKEASLGALTPGRFNAQQRLVLPYHLYAAECLNRFGSGHLEVEKGRQKRDE